MGKKCCIPHCYTGYRNYNEKYPMYGVPKDDFFLAQWQEAVARADRPITPNDCVCQRHFKPEDFIQSRIVKGEVERYKVPKLRPDAVPSIFPDLPESIHGTVKKRRKLSVYTEQYKLQLEHKKEEPELPVVVKDELEDEFSQYPAIETIKEEVFIKTEEDSGSDEKQSSDTPEESTGPKMFCCDLCDYKSKWPNNVQKHQTKHLEGDEYYYKCDLCPKFRTKWDVTYKNHMKIKHNKGPQHIYRCGCCSYFTRVKLCLKRHMERHERELIRGECVCKEEDCDFRTDDPTMYLFHLKSHQNKAYVETLV